MSDADGVKIATRRADHGAQWWTLTDQRKWKRPKCWCWTAAPFIKEVGLTKEGASALKHYLFHRGTQLVVPEVVAKECERRLAARAKVMKHNVAGHFAWLARFCGRVNGVDGSKR